MENVRALRFSPTTQPWAGVRNAAASGSLIAGMSPALLSTAPPPVAMMSGAAPQPLAGGVYPTNAAAAGLITLNGPGSLPGPAGRCSAGRMADSSDCSSSTPCQAVPSWVAYARYGECIIAAP